MAVAFVVIALAIAAGFGVARIKVDDSLSQLFRSDPPEFKQYEEVTRRFPSSEFDVLVVIEGKTLLARVLRVIGRRSCRLSRRPGQSRRIQTLGPLDGWDLVGACGGYQWRRHVHRGAATGDSPSYATFPYAAHQPELFGSTHLWSRRKARRCFGCHIDRSRCFGSISRIDARGDHRFSARHRRESVPTTLPSRVDSRRRAAFRDWPRIDACGRQGSKNPRSRP